MWAGPFGLVVGLVLAFAVDDDVAACESGRAGSAEVAAGASVEEVRLGVPEQAVVALLAEDRVAAGPALQAVVLRTTLDGVVPDVSSDVVGAGP